MTSSSQSPAYTKSNRRRWSRVTKIDELVKVKINVLRLVHHWGYKLDPTEIKFIPEYTYENFEKIRKWYLNGVLNPETLSPGETERSKLNKDYLHATHPAKRLRVIFVDNDMSSEKVKSGPINLHIAEALNDDISHLLLIISKPLNPSAKPDKSLYESRLVIDVFEDYQFFTTPIRHVLNQTHIKLTTEQRDLIMGEMRIANQQLPHIFITDPNVVYNGWKIGDMILILQYDPYSGGSEYTTTYRLVVAPAHIKQRKKS